MPDVEYAEMDVPGWSRRSDLELLADQLDAIEAWYAAQRTAVQADALAGLSREMRLDLRQRMAARRSAQEALLARADAQLRESRELLRNRPVRAVLVHRNEWLRGKVSQVLQSRGVHVVGELDSGPQAVGVLIVEQPDVMLLESALPLMTGIEVLRAARQYAPRTRVGAQLGGAASSGELIAAGAAVTFTRRVTPADIATTLAELVG